MDESCSETSRQDIEYRIAYDLRSSCARIATIEVAITFMEALVLVVLVVVLFLQTGGIIPLVAVPRFWSAPLP